MTQCNRCGQEKDNKDTLSVTLVHFICRECRQDNNELHLGHDMTIRDMESGLLAPPAGTDEWGRSTHRPDNY